MAKTEAIKFGGKNYYYIDINSMKLSHRTATIRKMTRISDLEALPLDEMNDDTDREYGELLVGLVTEIAPKLPVAELSELELSQVVTGFLAYLKNQNQISRLTIPSMQRLLDSTAGLDKI